MESNSINPLLKNKTQKLDFGLLLMMKLADRNQKVSRAEVMQKLNVNDHTKIQIS
jgi:hypothetical protein